MKRAAELPSRVIFLSTVLLNGSQGFVDEIKRAFGHVRPELNGTDKTVLFHAECTIAIEPVILGPG